MFKMSTEASYSWPVKIATPISGGKYESHTFDLVFKRLTQSKIKKLLNDPDASDVSFCKEVVLGWKGVTDREAKEIPFSEEAVDEFLDFPQMASTIVTTYLQSVAGAKIKN